MEVLHGILCLLAGAVNMYWAYTAENNFIKMSQLYCTMIMVAVGICSLAM